MLDEIDKLGMDFRGDPAAALLEVLDPEQNNSFVDHYLDVPFDLSRVMFIATANLVAPIPAPLLDRMEEIPLPGYTPDEKLKIAQRFLVPRQLEEHGLSSRQLELQVDVLQRLIEAYTREAGLRNLERQIGALCRKVARKFVEGRKRKIRLAAADLEEYLGSSLYFSEVAGRKGEIGVATGLAATAAGGEILFVEATRMKGRKNLILTGQLGEVMQESAQAALSYLRSQTRRLKIDPLDVSESDIHLHVPAGATPKDGPSAGIALTTALVSLFTGRPVRSDVAMTGEITLRGRVLPVGGIRDKVMGAQRAGIFTVIMPRKNEKDLDEVPGEIGRQMHFELVEHIDDVLQAALTRKKRRSSASAKRTARKK
jgi:ATP-dependent Lon protease